MSGFIYGRNPNADTLDGLDSAAFAILAGRAGGQVLQGGVAASETLTLESTAHGTKGGVVLTGSHVILPGSIRPAADSTAALTLCKANGTAVLTVDTTNSRVLVPLIRFNGTHGGSLQADATNDYPLVELRSIASSIASIRGAIDIVANHSDADPASGHITFYGYNGTGTEYRMVLTRNAVTKIAGTALRATTEGTNRIDIFDGTPPAGTLANGVSLYSASGKLWAMDAAGNATQLTP